MRNAPDAKCHIRRTMSASRLQGVIQFNIAFSIAVKLIFLVLAVFGYTSLWLAIAADRGATLIVTANALRLLRIEPPA
jgi:Zn2+/Cd2+-exporting ATPase